MFYITLHRNSKYPESLLPFLSPFCPFISTPHSPKMLKLQRLYLHIGNVIPGERNLRGLKINRKLKHWRKECLQTHDLH